MKDLTTDSITKHILTMAVPIAMTMVVQIAHQLVNLYFVARLGAAETAGVNAAANNVFIVTALAQVLGTGTAVLISHAVGRRDHRDASIVFNQCLILSVTCALAMMVLFALLIAPYLRSISTDTATIEAGITYTLWSLPGYMLMLPMAVLNYGLRGTGVVRPTFVIFTITIATDAVLAPVLIAGWGTGVALGVQGAGLASSFAILLGMVLFGAYMGRTERYLDLRTALMRPDLRQWRRILNIGLPAGSELVLTFMSTAVVYYTIRDFGTSAQAGFGIGSRILQAIVLPGIAIAVAAGPIAGQNFGAKNAARVRETFSKAALLGTAVMIATTIVVQWRPSALTGVLYSDESTAATATLFLKVMSWTFVAQGLVYVCKTMFQGLGNTRPSLITSILFFVVFTVPAVWLSALPGFTIEQVWQVFLASFHLQALASLWLLRIEFRKRLLDPLRSDHPIQLSPSAQEKSPTVPSS
jgi:putative MATE family efflux protein